MKHLQIIKYLFFINIFFLCAFNISAQDEKPKDDIYFNFSLSSFLTGSGAYYFQQSEFYGGFETWITAHADGSLSRFLSFYIDLGVALINAEREFLGNEQMKILNGSQTGRIYPVYGGPLAYFPYSYRGAWAGFVFPITELNSAGPTGWPDSTSIGFDFRFGASGSVFNDRFNWHIGRNDREAAAVVEGYSLALNKFAQPFFGFDMQVDLFSWLSMYHVAGILEYFQWKKTGGIKESAETFQNGFSLTMLSVSFKDYIQIDAGSSVIWPKRFEIGYILPTFHLLYQNMIGDFDNLGFFGNLKLQYPGLGFIWFSLFIDEMNFETDFFKQARQMYAYQAGSQIKLPFLPSGLITLSYTKIEPYCYTHQRVKVPWYSNNNMEQAYTNHGYGLGYYLPPNSDELKLVLAANATERTELNFQFQMIRHGAEYGEHKVYGSSYESELQEDNRSSDPRLRKDFLNDGAYQWLFVLKTGGKHLVKGIGSAEKLKMEFSLDAGVVISYWQLHGSTLDSDQYPSRTGIIFNAGFKIIY